MMLSISSTLHDIQQAHKQGMNTKQIARQLSVGENKLRRILTAAGFEFDQSLKQWRYVRMDDGAILQRSFWSLDEYGVGKPDTTGKTGKARKSVDTTGKTQKAIPSNTSNTESNTNNPSNTDNSNTNNPSNTDNPDNRNTSNTNNPSNTKESNTDNMSNISFTHDEILILKQLAARHAAAEPVTDSSDILVAIKDVPKGKTTKKTFAINDGVIAELDAFCDQHRIKKSDFVIMAIQDALNKFNGGRS